MRTPRPAPSAAGRAYPATGARKITRWRTCNRCSAGPNAGARTRPASRCRDVWTFSTAAVSTSTRGPVVVMPASSRSECTAASSPGPTGAGPRADADPYRRTTSRSRCGSLPTRDPGHPCGACTAPTRLHRIICGRDSRWGPNPRRRLPRRSSLRIAADAAERHRRSGADNGRYPLPRVGRTLGSWAHRSSRLPCPRSRVVVGDGRPVNVGRDGQRRWRTLIRCGGRWGWTAAASVAATMHAETCRDVAEMT
jgi:hypothetical protein